MLLIPGENIDEPYILLSGIILSENTPSGSEQKPIIIWLYFNELIHACHIRESKVANACGISVTYLKTRQIFQIGKVRNVYLLV